MIKRMTKTNPLRSLSDLSHTKNQNSIASKLKYLIETNWSISRNLHKSSQSLKERA